MFRWSVFFLMLTVWSCWGMISLGGFKMFEFIVGFACCIYIWRWLSGK